MDQSSSPRLKRLLFRFVAAFVGIYLVGCANSPATTMTVLPTVTVSAIDSAHSTDQAQPEFTVTPELPAPLSATFDPQALTLTPTPLPPALTEEEALAFVIKMQETNGGCELPCWWGITPGKTTGQEAEQILSALRELGRGRMVGAIYLYSLQLHVYSDLGFGIQVETKTSKEQPVDNIYIESFTTVIDDSVRYDESWQRYFVNELLTRLGSPSEVWLGFGPYGPEGSKRYFYELIVFYEDLGVTVEYAGPTVRGNPNRACLTLEQLKLLRLNVQNPSNPKMVRPPGPGEPFTDLRPLSEVTNLDLEKFYNSVKDADGQTCIESPANFWP